MTTIKPGRSRHCKGKEYTVIGVARHGETEEELVVYRQEYGDHALWVRPKAMFLETVKGCRLHQPQQEKVTPMSTQNKLQAAFAGESQANRKYLAFATKAQAE